MNGPTFAPATTPAAAPAAAPKPAARPAKPAARPEPDAAAGLRVLVYLRLHWLMILFCGSLLGSAGAYAAWSLLPSKYESYALLQVSSAPSSLASGGNRDQARTDFVTYVKTVSSLIKYEFVLNRALDDIKDLPTIKGQKEPIKFLNEELQVSAPDGSEVIRISMLGTNPGDVKRTVDSVQQAFMREVVQKDVAQKWEFLQKVERARDTMQRLLDQRAKRPEAARVGPPAPGAPMAVGVQPTAGTTPAGPPAPPATLPPLDPNAPAVPGPLQLPVDPTDRLAKLNPQILIGRVEKLLGQTEQLPLQITDARNRLAVLAQKAEALKKAPPDPATLAAVDRDPDVARQNLVVQAARRKYEFNATSASKDAPGVVALKGIWDAQQAALEQLREEKIRQIEGARKLDDARKLAAEWEAVKRELDRLEAQYAAAKASLARAERQLFELPLPGDKVTADGRVWGKAEHLYAPSESELDSTDGIYRQLVQKYHLTRLELESPPRVQVLQPASNPTQKDMRKQVLGTVFAGLMGFVVIALGVVAYETAARRVSSLADLKAAGPAPVVGVIPCQPEEAVGRDPVKRAAANEAIDKLRAYVAQTWLSRGATTVAVTSPLGDEGKAFAAFGLASSLAQAGYRTLLVDFDLREPALHTYAGVPNQEGVCEVLRSEADARAAIQSLPSGLHLLPAGRWSDEARKAAVGGRLEALLARLREPYDCVVLHGHALLTVAESVEVARRCEVVLVCARYRETKLPLLRKATDRVAAMEIPYSGVVYVGATGQEALC